MSSKCRNNLRITSTHNGRRRAATVDILKDAAHLELRFKICASRQKVRRHPGRIVHTLDG